MKESTINKTELLTGWFIEPYMGHTRVRVIYQKNGKRQNAVFMDYDNEGGRDYKLIEDFHAARNGLREKECQMFAELLNNEKIRLYANN